jgi:hypothetical protein
MWNYILYMESSGAAWAHVGGYVGPMSSVTVFQVLASVPFTGKSKRTCLPFYNKIQIY